MFRSWGGGFVGSDRRKNISSGEKVFVGREVVERVFAFDRKKFRREWWGDDVRGVVDSS